MVSVSRRGFAATGIFATLMAAAPLNAKTPTAARAAKLVDELPRIADLASYGLPGFQVAIIENSKIVYSQSFGTRSADGSAVDNQTVFDMGSLSKPIATVTALRLSVKGLFDLNRPLAQYIANNDLTGERADAVTGMHVLTQQTGLPNWRSFDPGAPLKMRGLPGTGEFGYSGEGFYWLQRAMEAATGESFPVLADREVINLLGLKRTSYIFEDAFNANYSQGQHGRGAEPEDGWNKLNSARVVQKMGLSSASDLKSLKTDEMRAASDPTGRIEEGLPSPVFAPANAAGSLHSTASDYARFLLSFMPGEATPLLPPDVLDDMMTPKVPIQPYLDQGLGWRLETVSDERSFYHTGFNEGYHTLAFGDVEGKSGVVCLTNSNRGNKLRYPVIHGATGRGTVMSLS